MASTGRNNRGGRRQQPSAEEASATPGDGKFNSVLRPWMFLFFLLWGIVLLAALAFFDNTQSFWFSEGLFSKFVISSGGEDFVTRNPLGKAGATFAVFAFNTLGLAAFLLPCFLFFFAFYMVRYRANVSLRWKTLMMFFVLCSGATLLEIIPGDLVGYNTDLNPNHPFMTNQYGPGGAMGKILFFHLFEPAIGAFGSTLLLACIYLFCFLGLFVSAPQKTIASGVNAFVFASKKYFENRRLQREYRARLREEQRKAFLAAQEQLRRNQNEVENKEREGKKSPAQEPPPAEDATVAHAPEPEPIDSAGCVPAEIPDGNETASAAEGEDEGDGDDDDLSDVGIDKNALSEVDAPVLEPLPGDATLTPIDFESPQSSSASEDDADAVPAAGTPPTPAAPAEGGLKVVSAETLERADDADVHSRRGDYVFPPLDLLAPPTPAEDQVEDYEARGREIIRVLAEFRCSAEMSSAQVGPTITRYEIKPGAGVKAERILGLQNNVAMALRAQSARLAPVPENGTIGIEVPNRKKQSVPIREVLESKAWHENKMEIPAVLGKDVTGRPVLIDLAKMPHGLIAGSSGSGKSVCLNGIITSILYNASPEDVRLVMVDPKVVELRVYNDAPHMLIPVITDMKRAPGALKWLIDEMERRYTLLEEAGVRNIVGYNAKVERDLEEAARMRELASASGNDNAFASAGTCEEGSVPAATENISVPRDEGVLDEARAHKKMPYIVCIIDEFADIMAQNAAEIETGVSRLTAKARAAGIHLILATQRPDAKTVTGLIKANLGTRIALRVTSGTNSRIILDEGGAETLIGKGDMLVLGPGSPFPQRAQGVWVSEEEIEKIVQFLADKNGKPRYADDVASAIESYATEDDEDGAGNATGGIADSRDELVGKAWEVIRTTKRASISNLQRKLGIGYNRAAKIIDILEEHGKVGPDMGPNKQREIYE